MTIEIISAGITDKILSLTAIDCSDEHLQWLERRRYDEPEREIRFEFDLKDAQSYHYIRNWLHRQAAVKKANPRYFHEAAAATVGTIVQSPQKKYRVWGC